MTIDFLLFFLGTGVIVAPLCLFILIGFAMLVAFPLGERTITRVMQVAVASGALFAFIILLLMLAVGKREVVVDFGDLVAIPQEHFHFQLRFAFDRLSVPFVILSYVL